MVLFPFAFLSCTTGPPNIASDPAAKTTAESFVRAWLSEDWEAALTYVAESGPNRESLSADHEFFRTHDFRVVGPARFNTITPKSVMTSSAPAPIARQGKGGVQVPSLSRLTRRMIHAALRPTTRR